MSIKMEIVIGAVLMQLALILIVFFSLGFHRPPKFIQNFETEEYEEELPFIKPNALVDKLAVYAVGEGAPVLLLPYPHGHVTEPMAQGPLADILVGMGRRVITFDPPGAFFSTGNPDGSMGEMLTAADQALEAMNVEGSVDIVGHSMGGLVALAYAVERPDRVRRLVLVNSVSGFPAAARCGFPGSAFHMFEIDYWRVILWGMRITAGRADFSTHKQLYNLMGKASFHDPTLFIPLEINQDDHDKGIPIRMIWSKNMYSGLSYSDQLGTVGVPTLITSGRHDPEAGIICSEELANGIIESKLVVFENSGHNPFIEEKERFSEILGEFLGEEEAEIVR